MVEEEDLMGRTHTTSVYIIRGAPVAKHVGVVSYACMVASAPDAKHVEDAVSVNTESGVPPARSAKAAACANMVGGAPYASIVAGHKFVYTTNSALNAKSAMVLAFVSMANGGLVVLSVFRLKSWSKSHTCAASVELCKLSQNESPLGCAHNVTLQNDNA